MVRIGLMARRNFDISRRVVLAGLGVGALGAGLSRRAVAGEVTPLRAKIATLALRPGQPDIATSALVGPTPQLRFKRGASLDIAFENELPGSAVVDWHGLEGVASAEPLMGQQALAGGARAGLALPLRHAGTLFGDLGLLAEGPSRALPLIVEENEAQPVDGDEVLLIEDYRLRSDGTAVSPGSPVQEATAVYTVNGVVSPDIAVHSGARLRLRFINGCQRHVIAVKIEGLEARVMAFDGQPAEPFDARNGAVVLAPGGRADVFVEVTLRSGARPQLLLHDGKEARAVGRLAIEGGITRRAPLRPAAALPSNGLPVQLELKGAQRIDLALAGNEWLPPTKFATATMPAFKESEPSVAETVWTACGTSSTGRAP